MKTEVPNNFLTTLQRHRGGKLLEEASEKLRDLTAAVHDTGKAGFITIKLSLKPAQRGQSAVVLTDTITNKIPQIEPEASFWFATDLGELAKDDPRQKQMFPIGVMEGGEPASTADQKKAATA